MNTMFTWKKGLFACSYQLMAGDLHIGALKEKMFSQSAIGSINQNRYKFQVRGILKQYTDIIDLNKNEVVGRISFSCWKPKATVQIGERMFHWKFSNLWETRWKLYNEAGNQLNFRGCATKGSIEMTQQEDLLALTGLFISNFYWNMVIIMMAALLPILFV